MDLSQSTERRGPDAVGVAAHVPVMHVLVESWSADLRMGATNDPIDLAEYGKSVGLHVSLCGPTSDAYRARVEEAGASWHDYTSVPFGRREIVAFGLAVLRGLQLLRRLRPDIVHINYAGWGPSLACAARWLGIPVAARPGAFDAANPATRWIDGYVALTETQAAHVLAAPRAPAVHFVGPFISLGRLADDAPDQRLPVPPRRSQGCRFLYLGQLVPRKGIDVLLQAFAAASVDGELLLVGGDWKAEPYAQELTRLIEQLGLSSRVTTCNHRTDVGNLLRECDVFVLPSHSEAIPRTVLEAMVLGRPVLATRVGGIPAIVTDGSTGVLVDPGDVDGLADAIRRLTPDAGLRGQLARAAQDWAATAVDPTATAKRYRSAYQRIIDGRAGGRRDG